MILQILMYVACGALAGFVSGLLGIGGGLVTVPFLVFYLQYLGYPPQHVMHMAIATSLVIIIFSSIASATSHHRHSGIVWPVVKVLFSGCLIGGLIGAKIADLLSSNILQLVFGLFVFFIAYRLAFAKPKHGEAHHLPGKVGIWSAGVFIATFCTILGMGGGSLLVPYFNHYGMSMRKSVGTSSACGVPIATAGVLGMILFGQDEAVAIPHTVGYVFWPAALAMLVPSILFAPIGARMAHRISNDILREIFAVFLVLVGIDMLHAVIKNLI